MIVNADTIKLKISELESALLSSHPQIPDLLRVIHKSLQADPEVVTLLKPEEIRVIVNGLEKHTKTELVETTAKSVKKTKVPKNITADDL